MGTESDIFQFQLQNAIDSFVLRMLETQCLESVIDIDFQVTGACGKNGVHCLFEPQQISRVRMLVHMLLSSHSLVLVT